MKPGKVHSIITDPVFWSKYDKTDNDVAATSNFSLNECHSPCHSPSSCFDDNVKDAQVPTQKLQFGFLPGGAPTPINTPTEPVASDGGRLRGNVEPAPFLPSSLKRRRATEPAILQQKRFKSNSVSNVGALIPVPLSKRGSKKDADSESCREKKTAKAGSSKNSSESEMAQVKGPLETFETKVSLLEELIQLMGKTTTFLQKEKKMRMESERENENDGEIMEAVDLARDQTEVEELVKRAGQVKETLLKALNDFTIMLKSPK